MQNRHPIPPRRSATIHATRTGIPVDLTDQMDFSETPARNQTSARRWVDTQGNQVIERGNQRIVVHTKSSPRRVHWLAIMGTGMTIMVALFIAWALLSNWWTDHQLDATYGFPRTYQVDEVVGYVDSTDHPTHFIFLNLNGRAVIIELPGGDITRAKIYSGPQIFADNPSSVPVTGEFKDVNGDGKIDLIVHIGEQRIIYINDGTQFKPQG